MEELVVDVNVTTVLFVDVVTVVMELLLLLAFTLGLTEVVLLVWVPLVVPSVGAEEEGECVDNDNDNDDDDASDVTVVVVLVAVVTADVLDSTPVLKGNKMTAQIATTTRPTMPTTSRVPIFVFTRVGSLY